MEGTESEEATEVEDDYMSDAFLQQLQDVRPGLLSRSRKRQRMVDEKQTKSQKLPKQKKINIAEKETREQALSTPISATNKGFSMLQKMGYKKGMGLGKTGMQCCYFWCHQLLHELIVLDMRSWVLV